MAGLLAAALLLFGGLAGVARADHSPVTDGVDELTDIAGPNDLGDCTDGWMVVGTFCWLYVEVAEIMLLSGSWGEALVAQDDDPTDWISADPLTDETAFLIAHAPGKVTLRTGDHPEDHLEIEVVEEGYIDVGFADSDNTVADGQLGLELHLVGVTPFGDSGSEVFLQIENSNAFVSFFQTEGGTAEYVGNGPIDVNDWGQLELKPEAASLPNQNQDRTPIRQDTAIGGDVMRGYLIEGLWIPIDGLPQGQYTIGVRVLSVDDLQTGGVERGIIRLETASVFHGSFTVGPAGTAVATGSVDLAHGDAARASVEDSIMVEVNTKNSLGNPDNLADLTSVTIVATGAHIAWAPDPDNEYRDHSFSVSGTDLQEIDGLKFQLSAVEVNGDPQAGQVDVHALILSSSGALTTETLTLSFYGGPAVLTLESGAMTGVPAAGSTADDDVKLALTAVDSGGSAADLTDMLVTEPVIKNADGTTNTDIDGDFVTDVNGDSSDGDTGLHIDLPTDVAPGVYTVEVGLEGVANSTVSATFTVTGDAALVDVQVDAPNGTALGSLVTITTTATDADGNAVSPRMVSLEVSSNLTMVGSDANTADGVLVRQAVVTGVGVATVTAEVDSVSGIAVLFLSPIEEEEAAAEPAEPAASLTDLSALNGFATWNGESDSSAAELFELVASRGASAILLWNGFGWIRYSVIDGTPVPGSSDFIVRRADVLYISN